MSGGDSAGLPPGQASDDCGCTDHNDKISTIICDPS